MVPEARPHGCQTLASRWRKSELDLSPIDGPHVGQRLMKALKTNRISADRQTRLASLRPGAPALVSVNAGGQIGRARTPHPLGQAQRNALRLCSARTHLHSCATALLHEPAGRADAQTRASSDSATLCASQALTTPESVPLATRSSLFVNVVPERRFVLISFRADNLGAENRHRRSNSGR